MSLIGLWYYKRRYEDFDDDDVLIKCYHDYQKRRAQKAKIKDELVRIAWHPYRVIDWFGVCQKTRRGGRINR